MIRFLIATGLATALLSTPLFSTPANAQVVAIATGKVADVEMGYEWVGWLPHFPNVGYPPEYPAWAGLQPKVRVTLDNGTTYESCWNGAVKPTASNPSAFKDRYCYFKPGDKTGDKIYQDATDVDPSNYWCHSIEYTNRKTGTYVSPQSNVGSTLGTQANNPTTPTTARLKPLLALLTSAGLKQVPIKLTAQGNHPNFLLPNCFDAVKICFTGTCQ